MGPSTVSAVTVQRLLGRDAEYHRMRCSDCGTRFETYGGLRKHRMKKHSQDVLTFQCGVCDQSFIDNVSLTAHHIISHKASGYTCEICDLSFSRKDNLRRHMHKHSKQQEFQCPCCESTFTRNDYMQRHVLTVHQQVTQYRCEVCDKRYKWKTGLIRHMTKKHSL